MPLAERSPNGLLVVYATEQGEPQLIAYANPAFADLVGVERTALEGEDVGHWLALPESVEVRQRILAQLAAGTECFTPATLLRVDGKHTAATLQIAPSVEEADRLWLIIVRSVAGSDTSAPPSRVVPRDR
jgi:PAS domain-containing protein